MFLKLPIFDAFPYALWGSHFIGTAGVFGAPCICRGALQSLTNATILPHLLSGLPQLVGHQVQQLERFWPGNFNSASQFTNLVSYHRNSSQIFLPWCVHIKFSKQIVWAIKKAQIFKYLLWYFAKLTGFFKIQYFKGHTPDWVLPKSLNADNSGQLYWLWQKKLKPGRQVSQCLMKSMICKRSETIMTIL